MFKSIIYMFCLEFLFGSCDNIFDINVILFLRNDQQTTCWLSSVEDIDY